MYTTPIEDLENIFQRLNSFWPKDQVFLITGGTGFFGRWIVEALCFIEKKLPSNNQFYILTRQSPVDVISQIPILTEKIFHIVQIDTEQPLHLSNDFDYVLHAAADVPTTLKEDLKTIPSKFTKNLISIVNQKRLKKILYISSGGIYNKKNDESCAESDVFNLDDMNTYSQQKIENENQITQSFEKNKFNIARCFSFMGPYANSGMIVMQMIDKKIKNEILNLSSPNAKRSYMYPSDLVVSLFSLLLRPTKHNIYNIGSDISIKLKDLAQKINLETTESRFEVHSLAGQFYYPNTDRINLEFKNLVTVDLNRAIQKTLKFQTERLKI